MSKMQHLRPWAELATGQNTPATDEATDEYRAAALFRRVEVPVRFDSERVALALLQRRSAPGPWRLVMATASVLLLGSAGAVAAARQIPPLSFWLMTISSTGVPSTPLVVTRAPAEPAVIPEAEPPAAIVEAPAPPRAVAIRAPARRLKHVRKPTPARLALAPAPRPTAESALFESAPPTEADPLGALELPTTPPATEVESPLARETRLLEDAFSQLRGNDPAAALETLNRYQEAHPLGVMRKEASSGRAEALLKLNRKGEALVVLQSYPFGEGAKDAELRVVRGELAAVKSCQDAIEDFSAAAEETRATAPVLERALRGRAVCEVRLGRRPEADASYRLYLRQFPNGKFAAEARRQLGERK